MERQKMNGAALARMLGIDRDATISDWVTGKKRPGFDMLVRLPAALNVSADWLLTGEGPIDRSMSPEAAQLAVIRMLQAADEAREMLRVPLSAFRLLPEPPGDSNDPGSSQNG